MGPSSILTAWCQAALCSIPRGSGEVGGLRLSFCPPPPTRTYSSFSSSSSWCLCRVITSSPLLSSCCRRPSRVSQVRPQPGGLPTAHTELPTPSPCVSPLVSPGLLPTPNLFQLPQQTQGALLTSQPRAGLPTQVSVHRVCQAGPVVDWRKAG